MFCVSGDSVSKAVFEDDFLIEYQVTQLLPKTENDRNAKLKPPAKDKEVPSSAQGFLVQVIVLHTRG